MVEGKSMGCVTAHRGRPLVSVLLPVYNGEKFLSEAIESVLQQTFMDFELLILDDGSIDGSLAICQHFERIDRRVRVFHRENRGLVITLNEMIDMANGEILARMDADDICLPQRFERQVDFLRLHPDIDVVGTSIIHINSAGQRIGPIDNPLDHDSIEALLLNGHCAIAHPSVMVRAEAIIKAGGYREAFPCAQDFDLWLRMSEQGRLANIPDRLLLYRLHPGSISESKGQAQREAAERAAHEAWARRGMAGQFHSENLWRAGTDVRSQHEFALQYGWTAWSSGYRSTWRTYVWKAMRLAPLSIASWKLALYGLLTRPASKRNR